jgi:pilus assembly protein CpaB
MRVVTIVSLGASAVLGLAALFVAKAILPNAAKQKAAATAAGQPQITGVPVVVARSALKFGDRLDPGKVMVIQLPSNAVPEGSFSTVDAVLHQDNGGPPAALTQIAAREPLLPAKLSGPGARASVAAEIAEGMRAYTIKVTDVTGVGGHALPGDRVDVVLLRDTTPEGPSRNWVSEVVIQDVRVLGVDLNADLTSNKPTTPTTATLEVSVPDAQKLAVAGDLGKLSLALRKTGAAEIARVAPMRTGNFVSGGGGGRTSTARRPGAAFTGPGLIMIVEGGGRRGSSRALPPPPAPPVEPVPAAAPAPAAS